MKFLKAFLFYLSIFFYFEYVYKVQVFHIWFDAGLFYTGLFTLVYALLFTILISIIPKKISFPVTMGLIGILTFIYLGEAIFTMLLGMTFSMYSLNMAGQAMGFISFLSNILINHSLTIGLFLLPMVIFIVFHKKILCHYSLNEIAKYIPSLCVLYLVVLKIISFDSSDIYSPYNLYYNTHAPTIMVKKLGLLTEFRLDVTRYLLGFNPKMVIEDEDISIFKEQENVTEYNELDIDFDKLNDTTNTYIKNRKATNKNEYTGILEGKNLIYILAEGFNSIAVDKELTPTLYNLVNSGFVFTNYYSPMFMSTTGGEFQFSLSLIPTQMSLNSWKTGKTTFPYAVGNAFKDMGYKTFAYHNWNYFYYHRDITMPLSGYESFMGCGNGLERRMNCKIWPPSDVEMIEATFDDYINEDRFAVHYITVSGHAEYNFDGNNMARKNEDYVKDLEYSSSVKAYLATQIELDHALELLISKLKESNKFDNTVIVLSGDHYPYFLSVEEVNELSTYKRDETFETNRSNLILYNSSIPKTKVDKLASSVDVLPTILNMFNYKYDSRLLIGSDIMSKHDSLVIFSDYSWISEKGRYNAKTEEFVPIGDFDDADSYVSRINAEVQNRINACDYIITSNYYEKILAK